MAQERIRMPTTEAGLVRYGDEAPSKFVLKPEAVIGLSIAVIVLAVVLQILF